MAMSAASHRSTTSLGDLTLLFVFAVLVADVGGRHHVVCPPFPCGGLSNVSYPFRQQGDPHGCGVHSYELVCTETSATIRIGSGTYNVLSINYTGSYFRVVDAGMQNNCPLPRWDYYHGNSHRSIELAPSWRNRQAIFMNCSQEIKYNSFWPVKCLSTTDYFIYVLIVPSYGYYAEAHYFVPSCGYLSMTPLGGPGTTVPENASYPDIVKLMGKGFAIDFPFKIIRWGGNIRGCLAVSKRDFHRDFRAGTMERILGILRMTIDLNFLYCVTTDEFMPANRVTYFLLGIIRSTLLVAMLVLTLIHGTHFRSPHQISCIILLC